MAEAKSVLSWRKFKKTVQSFYPDSRVCVRVGNDVSEWFPVNVGLRRLCDVPMVV